jgi:hypothetical protein
MTTSNFIHWSGAFAFLGGISTLIMAYYMIAYVGESPPMWGSLLYLALFLSLPIALVGIYVHQKVTAGSLGLIAFLVALGGAVLFNCDIAQYFPGKHVLYIISNHCFQSWLPRCRLYPMDTSWITRERSYWSIIKEC